MANKTQAKAAIDSAATIVKADIDNILPIGVDIIDGHISFAPTRYSLVMNQASEATALSWSTTIQTNLTSASRGFVVLRSGRRIEPQQDTERWIEIRTTSAPRAVFRIQGF